MTVLPLGTKTIGGCLPSSLEAAGAIDASVAVSMPKIQAQLAGLVDLNAKLSVSPPTLQGSLDGVLQIAANIQAAISVGAPDVGVQLSAISALTATLQAELASLQAQLAISGALNAALAPGGVHLYGYVGQAGQLGNEFQSELSGGFPGGSASDQSYAIMLATSSPESKVALEFLFGVDLSVS